MELVFAPQCTAKFCPFFCDCRQLFDIGWNCTAHRILRVGRVNPESSIFALYSSLSREAASFRESRFSRDLAPEAPARPNGIMDTHPRTRASGEPTGHRRE